MISESDVEKAVSWLIENASKAAAARATRQYVEEYRKVLKAQLMRENSHLAASVQEREAYADPRYIEHLDAVREAVAEDERMRWLQTAAEAKISAWQSQSRNQRVNV